MTKPEPSICLPQLGASPTIFTIEDSAETTPGSLSTEASGAGTLAIVSCVNGPNTCGKPLRPSTVEKERNQEAESAGSTFWIPASIRDSCT
jgi:hypothetical protein